MPEFLDKKQIYSSKIMNYYRRMLKAESKGELFAESMPPVEQFWDSGLNDTSNDTNQATLNNLFSSNKQTQENNYPWSSSSKPNNPPAYPSWSDNNSEYKIPDYSSGSNTSSSDFYPKSEIVINDNHYQQAKSFAESASSYSNKIPSEPKFAQIDPKYKNDSRYASIGSEPMPSSYGSSSGGGYLSSVGSFLGTVWGYSSTAASAVKDKMTEYEVGNKLVYVGGKALQAIAYTGSKMYEKGTELAQSETVHNLASKAGEGLGYIKDKIVGGGSGSSHRSSYGNDSYGSRSSDDYMGY